MRALLILALVGAPLGAGCGARAAPETPPKAAHAAPSTAWDPPTWTPPPADDAHTDATVGVSASGGYDQPRWILLRFVRAVRDADEAALERLLADPVFSTRLHERPRSWWVERLTRGHRRQGLGPEVPVDHLVAIRRVEVRTVGSMGATPRGLEPTDLVLTFPLAPAGRRWLGPLLLWRERGHLLVRPGRDPRVLGL